MAGGKAEEASRSRQRVTSASGSHAVLPTGSTHWSPKPTDMRGGHLAVKSSRPGVPEQRLFNRHPHLIAASWRVLPSSLAACHSWRYWFGVSFKATTAAVVSCHTPAVCWWGSEESREHLAARVSCYPRTPPVQMIIQYQRGQWTVSLQKHNLPLLNFI